MDRNEITANIIEQEDQAMPPLIAFDKEKLIAMQKKVLEGMTQYGVLHNAHHKVKPTYQRDQ